MSLTVEDTLVYNIELWKWLVANPENRKVDWPKWENNGGDLEEVESSCFCCEFARQEYNRGGYEGRVCNYCPVKEEFEGCNGGSLWYNWEDYMDEENYEEAEKCAKDILKVLEDKLVEIRDVG